VTDRTACSRGALVADGVLRVCLLSRTQSSRAITALGGGAPKNFNENRELDRAPLSFRYAAPDTDLEIELR
jgi:hypothetical protein